MFLSTVLILTITLLNIIVYILSRLEQENSVEEVNVSSRKSMVLPVPSDQLCRRFSFPEIQSATRNFDEALVIGQGGFGKVYKGVIDSGATTVAIKRLNPMSNQGGTEFWTEIEMLSKFRHTHLVSLIGYCSHFDEMILIYEYMLYGSMADHLHPKNGESSPLSWMQRLKICIGAARGLDYLHTGTGFLQTVIHRDVKSSNILLDENWVAKVSDFGLSKIGPANQSSTHITVSVKGTPGYCDPEYYLTRRLTRKSDVYAFGVVLFEVLSGRPALDFRLDEEQRHLAAWAQHCIKEDKLLQMIDPSLKWEIRSDSLKAFVRIANSCLLNRTQKRPTMAEVVVLLESALKLQESKDSSILDEDIFNFNGASDDKEEANSSTGQPEVNDAEEAPGIDGLQIIGDATTGGVLRSCGYSVRGTSSCLFQWVRHLQDGTSQMIEGATRPEYIVTADDVNTIVAVECIPLDDQGRQGELVTNFANERKKITWDPDMKQEIDRYISARQAAFNVQLLEDSSENWEPTTFILRRFSYEVKVNRTDAIVIAEKFSKHIMIKTLPGISTQFVLTCSDGSSHTFKTFNDIGMCATLLCTMKLFQSKALGGRRKKWKALFFT